MSTTHQLLNKMDTSVFILFDLSVALDPDHSYHLHEKLLTSFPVTHRLLGFSSYFSDCSLLGSLADSSSPGFLTLECPDFFLLQQPLFPWWSQSHSYITYARRSPKCTCLAQNYSWIPDLHIYCSDTSICILNRHFKLHLSKTELSILPNPAPPPGSSF